MVMCILCRRPMAPLFRARDYRRADDHEEWQVAWCANCEFGRLEGQFTPNLVASFYPPVYYTHGAELHQEVPASFLDRLRAHLAWRLDWGVMLRPSEVEPRRSSHATLCDLGCGSGEQLRLFREAGYRVIGIEPDPRARVIARQSHEVLEGTAENLPANLAEMKFDVVLLSHVLEHCIDPMKVLANARQILEPNGTLLIEVPNNRATGFSRFGAVWPWSDIPRHLNFFTERSLRTALLKSGFGIERVLYVGYSRQFQSEWLRTEEKIWSHVGCGESPNFEWEAWKLLLRTAFASDRKKYNSVRVHAVPILSADDNRVIENTERHRCMCR